MDDDDEAPFVSPFGPLLDDGQREALRVKALAKLRSISHEAARSMIQDAALQWPDLKVDPLAKHVTVDATWPRPDANPPLQGPPLQGPPMPMPGDDPYPSGDLRAQILALKRENAALRHEIDMGNAAEPAPVEDAFPARALACWPNTRGMARFLP